MPDHVSERRVWLPRPVAQVVALLADPAHRALVQPGTGLTWLAPPPAALEAGALLDFRVGLGGVRARWRVIVREWDPPHRMVEAGLWGPFARWEHRCRLAAGPEAAGGPPGTWLDDALVYRAAAGPLGRAWHALAARRALHRAFDARAARLRAWAREGY
jgi:hypothetical protein